MNALQKLFGIKDERNPDGLTFDEFVKKYSEMKHIAYLCWYLGCEPEQLKDELKLLMDKSESSSRQVKQQSIVK